VIRFDDVHSIMLLAREARISFVPGLHHCVARYTKSDLLMGGVLYTDYREGASIAMHFARFHQNWVSRSLIYVAFDYPFRQLKVRKVFGLIAESNVKSRNLALHFGFKIEAKIDDVFNRPDGVNGQYVMGMLKDDCRWLNMKMPFIEFALPEYTNRIDMPLAHMEAVGPIQ
jgi:hypothetical protein